MVETRLSRQNAGFFPFDTLRVKMTTSIVLGKIL